MDIVAQIIGLMKNYCVLRGYDFYTNLWNNSYEFYNISEETMLNICIYVEKNVIYHSFIYKY